MKAAVNSGIDIYNFGVRALNYYTGVHSTEWRSTCIGVTYFEKLFDKTAAANMRESCNAMFNRTMKVCDHFIYFHHSKTIAASADPRF